MAQNKNQPQPTVVVLTSEDLAGLVRAFQDGIDELSKRLDQIEEKLGLVTVAPVVGIDAGAEERTRRAAKQALKDVVTRPTPSRRRA